jgi:single-stranded DNA-specific DHH superfamily exonuclease
MSDMSKLDELSSLARPAVNKIKAQHFVRVVSHHDADGITACGIVCHMLQRLNIPFQATIVSNLDNSIEKVIEPGEFVIFCDMGSGQPDIVNKYQAVILDHHMVLDGHKQVHVNPHLVGIDGGSEVSGSGVAYALARTMGKNADLAGLAVSGAIGDKQKMVGVNKDILGEGVKSGAITVQKGLKLGKGPLEKVLACSTDPYFDFSGRPDEAKKFIDELGLKGNIESLAPEELKRLSSALTLKLLKKSPPDTIDSLIGDTYILNDELIKDVYDFSNTVNSCGKLGVPGLGLSVCLRYRPSVEEAEDRRFDYAEQILKALHDAISSVQESSSLRYLDICCSDVTGAIASTIIRYVMPDKPIIVLNTEDGNVKISARGTADLISKGLDLSVAIRESAKQAGGSGGGHKIASGGMIPRGTEKTFLAAADAIIGRQLNGIV